MTGPLWFMKRTKLLKRRVARTLESFLNYHCAPIAPVSLRYGRLEEQAEQIEAYGIGVVDLGSELEKP